jgi:predicted nucleic acid-binding Zn ribbon protein
VPSGRPRLRLVKTEPPKDPPQRDAARKTAPRATHGVWGTQWKVEKEFRDSPGLAFIRRHLSLYDYSQLEWLSLRRSPRPYFPWKDPIPIFGTCVTPEATSSGLFRVNCNLLTGVLYPVRLWDAEGPSSGEPYLLDDENEAVVAIIALEVGLYLGRTGQMVGVEAIDFMQAAVEAYRRNIGDATSSDEKLPGNLAPPARAQWCVVCGRPLSKGGGSQFFCSGGCRSTYHGSQRRARLAARRGRMACAECGKTFTPTQLGAKTCSPACRQKKYRRKLRNDRSNPGHDDHRDRHSHDDDLQERAGPHEPV